MIHTTPDDGAGLTPSAPPVTAAAAELRPAPPAPVGTCSDCGAPVDGRYCAQ